MISADELECPECGGPLKLHSDGPVDQEWDCISQADVLLHHLEAALQVQASAEARLKEATELNKQYARGLVIISRDGAKHQPNCHWHANGKRDAMDCNCHVSIARDFLKLPLPPASGKEKGDE